MEVTTAPRAAVTSGLVMLAPATGVFFSSLPPNHDLTPSKLNALLTASTAIDMPPIRLLNASPTDLMIQSVSSVNLSDTNCPMEVTTAPRAAVTSGLVTTSLMNFNDPISKSAIPLMMNGIDSINLAISVLVPSNIYGYAVLNPSDM